MIMFKREELNEDILNSEKAQDRLKELIGQSETWYIDCIYNVAFIPARLKATEEDLEKEEDEDMKRQLRANVLKNNKDLEANKNWLKQYEEVIPYFKTLLK